MSFENFPYTNFHEMNMDWIISVVKDFLGKYTNIETTINTGLENIQTTTSESIDSIESTTETSLETIWQELAYAIESFGNQATARAQQAISSIPSDYTEFYQNALVYRGSLANGADFNTITNNGVWGISSGRSYVNKPNIESGFLISIKYQDDFNIQIALSFNGSSVYSRQNINGTFSSWEVFNNTNVYSGVGLLENNSDLNNCRIGSVWGLGSERTYAHKPAAVTSGIIITFRFDSSSSIKIQYISSFENGIWRRYFISSWTDWSKVDTPKAVENFGRLENNTDLNDVKNNSIYALGSERTYGNSPIQESGWLFTLEFQSNVTTQIAMNLNGQEIYVRYYLIDHWVEWFSQTRKNPAAHYYAFGDSIVWGQTTPGTQSKYNYPAMTGRALQMIAHNYATPGQGLVKDWNAIHTRFINDLDMSNAKLITVGWAYNDLTLYRNMPFGSAASVDSTSLIGKYYTILKEFQQKCPLAKIVLITGYGHPNGIVDPVTKPTLIDQFTHSYTFSDGAKTIKEIYDTLEEMCHKHGWSCINQAKGTAVNQFNAASVFIDQIHMVDNGYYVYGQYLSGKIASEYSNTSM